VQLKGFRRAVPHFGEFCHNNAFLNGGLRMQDRFVDDSNEGSKGRIRLTALAGASLVLLGVVLLVVNEVRAAAFNAQVGRARHLVTTVSGAAWNPALEGSLVCAVGQANPVGLLKDPVFQVSCRALKFQRTAMVYQWREQEAVGKGRGRFEYFKTWADTVEDWRQFRSRKGHRNVWPRVGTRTVVAPITIGGYQLSSTMVDRLDNFNVLSMKQLGGGKPYRLSPPLTKMGLHPDARADGVHAGFYLGADLKHPHIGDSRIVFQAILPQTLTVLAKQSGHMLIPGTAPDGRAVCNVSIGNHPASELFTYEPQDNGLPVWAVRLAGIALLGFGGWLIIGWRRTAR
jgi:hypothetical protein